MASKADDIESQETVVALTYEQIIKEKGMIMCGFYLMFDMSKWFFTTLFRGIKSGLTFTAVFDLLGFYYSTRFFPVFEKYGKMIMRRMLFWRNRAAPEALK